MNESIALFIKFFQEMQSDGISMIGLCHKVNSNINIVYYTLLEGHIGFCFKRAHIDVTEGDKRIFQEIAFG